MAAVRPHEGIRILLGMRLRSWLLATTFYTSPRILAAAALTKRQIDRVEQENEQFQQKLRNSHLLDTTSGPSRVES